MPAITVAPASGAGAAAPLELAVVPAALEPDGEPLELVPDELAFVPALLEEEDVVVDPGVSDVFAENGLAAPEPQPTIAAMAKAATLN